TRNAVYGQHHNVDACVLRALQHCPVEAAILVEIELINLRRIVCLTQLLEAHRAERRHAEHRAIFRSRGRDGAFTLMVEQALQGSGRAIDRQRELLAHDPLAETPPLHRRARGALPWYWVRTTCPSRWQALRSNERASKASVSTMAASLPSRSCRVSPTCRRAGGISRRSRRSSTSSAWIVATRSSPGHPALLSSSTRC